MFFRRIFQTKKDSVILREWNMLIKYSNVKNWRVKLTKNWNLFLTIPFSQKDNIDFKNELINKWNKLLEKYISYKKISWVKENILFWIKEIKKKENLENYLKQQIISKTKDYMIKYSKILNVKYNKFTIKKMKSRWGSCSNSWNISINFRLVNLPVEYLEYVVIHELCHLIYPNHWKKFWSKVEKICPNYKNIKQQMRKIIL